MIRLANLIHAMICLCFLLGALVMPGLPVLAEDYSARVVGVTDGDTLTIRHGNRKEEIVLGKIDCPELSQPYSKEAKSFTSGLALNKTVTVIPQDKDRYGRVVAQIILPDGKNLSAELVKAGLAWQYWKYSYDPLLSRLESQARQKGLGLWADYNPKPPWKYRKEKEEKLLRNYLKPGRETSQKPSSHKTGPAML